MAKKTTYLGKWIRETFRIFVDEFRMVLHDNGVMLIFCFAGLVYPLLYNWIYGYGVVDEMPVAVVDNSQGSYSRRYIREVDATREVAIAYDCVSLAEARELMERQQVHGIHTQLLQNGHQVFLLTLHVIVGLVLLHSQ